MLRGSTHSTPPAFPSSLPALPVPTAASGTKRLVARVRSVFGGRFELTAGCIVGLGASLGSQARAPADGEFFSTAHGQVWKFLFRHGYLRKGSGSGFVNDQRHLAWQKIGKSRDT